MDVEDVAEWQLLMSRARGLFFPFTASAGSVLSPMAKV